MPDHLKDAALLACFALIVVLWSLYSAASSGGYRQGPEQTSRDKQEWVALAVAFPLAMAAFWVLETWKDELIASLSLSRSGYGWLRAFVLAFVFVATGRFLNHRRQKRSQSPVS
jgi:membrane protease YdiL (CAAX protease family)